MDDLLALVCDVYFEFVIFSFGILGQVWYLIVSILDPCCLSYFYLLYILNQDIRLKKLSTQCTYYVNYGMSRLM